MSFDRQTIKARLQKKDPSLFFDLKRLALQVSRYDDVAFLITALKRLAPSPPGPPLKVALLGGPTLFPLNEVLGFYLTLEGFDLKFFTGGFNNYRQEVLDGSSDLYKFAPDFTILIPDREQLLGDLRLGAQDVDSKIAAHCDELNLLAQTLFDRSSGEVLVCNHILPGNHDLGSALRTRLMSEPTHFLRKLNLALGERLDARVVICDVDFLSSRLGLAQSSDAQFFLETRNIYSLDFNVILAQELALLVLNAKRAQPKVVAVDLDHTLWGGIIGDDGVDGIELGETSSRGRAFREFQRAIRKLKERGLVLAVCSKNEESIALEAIDTHPEMVLRKDDFVSLKINWEPKSKSLAELARELNVGLDSVVFIDDNAAEIELIRQQLPEVKTILLDSNPALYVGQLQNSRLFEPRRLTDEDRSKTLRYQQETKRTQLAASIGNLESYLASLEMVCEFKEFDSPDIPRISQLINKSNQFNLTTIRRSEADIDALMKDPKTRGYTVRLRDKFGDYGLVSVLILKENVAAQAMEIETWVMSCRVLKRELEQAIINRIADLMKRINLVKLFGTYVPTKKNIIVKDLYSSLGFTAVPNKGESSLFALDLRNYADKPTKIIIK